MKKFLLLMSVLFASISFFSQNDYEDLINLRVDEKYEKLLFKSEKYILSEKSKKDPLPYLFMSIGYYEISKLAEFSEEYPKAFKNALKYAVKYVKKDKNSEFYDDYNDYFEELRHSTMIEAEALYDQEKYSKVKGFSKYLYKIDDNDLGAWVLNGLCLERMKYAKESSVALAKAKELFDTVGCDNLTPEQLTLLKQSLIKLGEYYAEIGKNSEAKEWMELGMENFGDDDFYKITFESL